MKQTSMRVRSMAVIFVFALAAALFGLPHVARAACNVPSTNYGVGTMNINVTTAGTYRIWSRIMAPDTTNTSYLLQVDPSGANSCFTIGGASGTTPNSWKWADYQNGTTSSKVDVNLSVGAHTLVMIGTKPGVKLDRVMLLSDTTCIPSDNSTGDECASLDTIKPAIALTAPKNATTVNGLVTVSATATDNSGANGVSKVEFYINGVLKSTATTAAAGSTYSYNWDTAALSSGSYAIKAVAYDASSNTNADTVTVTVKQSDTTAPTIPANVSATADSSTKVTVKWSASTDNVAVNGYQILRGVGSATPTPYQQVNGATLSFTDTPVSAATTYTYQVIALDTAGNASKASLTATATTPKPTQTDTAAPSVPQNVRATAVSKNQINLSWPASTDNVGVISYDVYRAVGDGTQAKVATVPVTGNNGATSTTIVSYGDGNLEASTTYKYTISARDAAGNASAKSAAASATTLSKPATQNRGTVKGTVWDKQGNELKGITITLTRNGSKHTYTTNDKGVYSIYDLPAGNYKLRFDGNGYWNQTITVRVKANKTVTQNVVMSRNN